MKFKKLLFLAIAFGAIPHLKAKQCPFGACTLVPVKKVTPVTVRRVVPTRVKRLVAYNAIRPVKLVRIQPAQIVSPSKQFPTGPKVTTGYRVKPDSVSLMIHIPNRPESLFQSKQSSYRQILYSPKYFSNGFNTEIRHGGDWITLDVRNGNQVHIECWDYKWKRHIINSTIPHKVNNIVGRVQVKMYANTIEVIMPRF